MKNKNDVFDEHIRWTTKHEETQQPNTFLKMR